MSTIFHKHPMEVCMTYWEHLQLSMTLSYYFAEGSLKAFVHAIFPFWFPSSSTNIKNIVTEKITKSGCRRMNDEITI